VAYATLPPEVEEAKQAALEVLLHNVRGPCRGLPRTAAWGYPEPYTRDWMISALGILTSGDEVLIAALRRVFLALAENQTPRGHIPSLAHDPRDLGASDTTPLFLMALAFYRRVTGEHDFLAEAARKAMLWMEYQSPCDRVIVAQLPTTDWRDEQWVLGFGLYVNTIVYAYLRLFGQHERAAVLHGLATHFVVRAEVKHRHVHEGLAVPYKPYYATWAYKIHRSERFDLLGNSLAVLTGFAAKSRAKQLIGWIEAECTALRERGDLASELPPCFFPYINPGDPDWMPRYERFGRPGEYHNGGIWPFICGFHIAAALAAGYPEVAQRKLLALTEAVKPARDHQVAFGFNEWIRAQDGTVQGQDWQTWSAAMYLYAAACVERGEPLFFSEIRTHPQPVKMKLSGRAVW
jgi:hypothetical protein